MTTGNRSHGMQTPLKNGMGELISFNSNASKIVKAFLNKEKIHGTVKEITVNLSKGEKVKFRQVGSFDL